MTDTFQIFVRSQGFQVLCQNGIECAHIVNGKHGWQAWMAEKTDRMSNQGPIYAPIGGSIGVSHLINQHGGADQIAALLGL